jgi:hypothetical protein
MCTVVVRHRPDEPIPVQMLALRDELFSRPFDPPGEWWPDQASVVGGRDLRGGGSWCVSDIATGTTAVVLNRPEKRDASPGAASRGVLPLAAVRDGVGWLDAVDIAPMAGFNLVLATPTALCWWSWDGTDLRSEALPPATVMFTPTGRQNGPLDELISSGGAHLDPADLTARSSEDAWPEWLSEVRAAVPSEDRSSLVVRKEIAGDSYETVFGQLIASRPGALRLDYLRHVVRNQEAHWTTAVWQDPRRPGRQRAPAAHRGARDAGRSPRSCAG